MKAYTVAIPNIPLFPSKPIREFLKYIKNLDGYIGMHLDYPRGTILLFKSKQEAIRGRNLIKHYPSYQGSVGDNICEVDIDD